jgi:hypothetical protein
MQAESKSSLMEAFEVLETGYATAFDVFRRRRLCAGSPATLQRCADEHGISRERARQLEVQFWKQLQALPDGDPVATAAARLAEVLGPAARAERLLQAIQELGLEAATQPSHRLRLLLTLAGPYREEDGWCFLEEFQEEAEEALERLTAEIGGAPLDSAAAELCAIGLQEQDVGPWIAASPRFGLAGDCVLRLGGSIADRGVAILALRGEPMTLEEIFEALAEDKSLRSFKNQMQGDPQVRRVGVKHYGLASWEEEEYTTVADEMAQEIERRGEPVELDELARTLAERFGVSPSSVRMYASGARFSVDAEGMVSVGGDDRMPETKPLALTRGCFRLNAGWALRKVVDHDVERGSGTGIPFGFAKEIGLSPGASIQLPSPHGPISCSWLHHTASLGSIRKAMLDLGAEQGDYLFVISCGDRLEFDHVAAAACEQSSGIERLALECGAGEGTADAIAAALAIGGSASGPAALQIRRRLLERGEEDLAALVPDADEDLLDVLTGL